MSLGGTAIGKAFNFINDPLGILPADVYKYMFDPAGIFATQPDIPTTGNPDPEQAVMKSEIGVPVPDLTGTAKIPGHLLCFGNERNQAVYTQSTGGGKGGGGGGGSQISGYKYFMSWALGFCACPGDSKINTLYAIYKNDDALPVWSGELDCPVSGGQETIVLDGIGSVDFYFGTNDQAVNPKVAEIISDPTLNTPYRNMCWAFFDDCFIGQYNRTPTYKFIMKKIPEYSFSTDKATIQKFDVNPANSMYYILSNLAGLPVSWLDSDDFETIANTLFDESRGICVLLDRQQSVLSYLESINSHVDNIIRYGADAKFHPKLIRDDYDVGSIPTIDESVMLEDPSFSRGSWIDTVNELKVQYNEIRPSIAFIYGLFTTPNIMFGLSFDGANLSYIGKYDPSDSLWDLIMIDDDIAIYSGSEAAAKIHQVSTSNIIGGEYQVIAEHSIFNAYDFPNGSSAKMVNGRTFSEFFIINKIGMLIRIDEYLKQERTFIGSITVGTDTEDYWCVGGKGITQPPAPSNWVLIGDNETVRVESWVDVGGYGCDATDHYIQVDGDNIFDAGWDAPNSFMTTLDVNSTYAINDVTNSGFMRHFTILENYIYGMNGVAGTNIQKWNKALMSPTGINIYLAGYFGDITNMGGFIIASTIRSSGDYGIYKLNADTLAIEESIISSGTDYGLIRPINDTYLAMLGNRVVSVLNIDTMEIVDSLDMLTIPEIDAFGANGLTVHVS